MAQQQGSQVVGLSTATTAINTDEDEADTDPDPTAIQKADLLITQQWLRLIVWQSSFRQNLLSWASAHESMHFAFPLAIARRTAAVLASLPPRAIEVHGMGIFEKIFEIGSWCFNVLNACDRTSTPSDSVGSRTPTLRGFDFGFDFIGEGDVGLLGSGRAGVAAIDPLELFVRTLSASPNSRTQFADRLLLFAQDRPAGMKMALSPPLTVSMPPGIGIASVPTSGWSTPARPASAIGTVLGEVGVDETQETDAAPSVMDLPSAIPGQLQGVVDQPLDPSYSDPFSQSLTMASRGTIPAGSMPTWTTTAQAFPSDGYSGLSHAANMFSYMPGQAGGVDTTTFANITTDTPGSLYSGPRLMQDTGTMDDQRQESEQKAQGHWDDRLGVW
jgi:hypothetical protein